MPICTFYHQLPARITELKLDVISNYNYNQRFLTVNLIALSTALLSFRRYHNVELMSHSLTAIRNTGVAYLVSGLFIAP